ncbi:hypothetical protein ABIA33_004878 [Streptacidiphilus sp. MAP12-16]|uniref:hypothetical protein n=1 Tax=Streptacidiphilus sp. MAP12-16 TaxID=3156300 RepID=UPI00351942A0
MTPTLDDTDQATAQLVRTLWNLKGAEAAHSLASEAPARVNAPAPMLAVADPCRAL